jgi:hypothetical protein
MNMRAFLICRVVLTLIPVAETARSEQTRSTEEGRLIYQMVMNERNQWNEVRTGVYTITDSPRGLTRAQTHSQLITGLLHLSGLELQPVILMRRSTVSKSDSVIFIFSYAGKQLKSLDKNWEPITFQTGGRNISARSLGWFEMPEGGVVISLLPIMDAIQVLQQPSEGSIGKERFTLNPTLSETSFGRFKKSEPSRVLRSFGSYLRELIGEPVAEAKPFAELRVKKIPTEPTLLGGAISARYDKFKDRVSVVLPGQELLVDLRSGHLQMGVAFFSPGDTVSNPEEVFLSFLYEGKEWRFLNEGERSLVFMLGDERVPLSITAHDSKVGENGYGVVRETMLASVTPKVAIRILEANAEGQIGFTDFKLTESARFAYREFAALLRALEAR